MMNNVLQWLFGGKARANAGMAAVLLAGLSLCMAVAGSWMSWQRFHSSSVALISPHPLENALPAVSAAKLADRHLFGAGQTPGTAALPQTHLQLELTGIMGAAPESQSMAIISMAPGQPGQVYRVGDILPSLGVRVHAITHEAVVLENGGHLERLVLQRQPLRFGQMPKSFLGG